MRVSSGNSASKEDQSRSLVRPSNRRAASVGLLAHLLNLIAVAGAAVVVAVVVVIVAANVVLIDIAVVVVVVTAHQHAVGVAAAADDVAGADHVVADRCTGSDYQSRGVARRMNGTAVVVLKARGQRNAGNAAKTTRAGSVLEALREETHVCLRG